MLRVIRAFQDFENLDTGEGDLEARVPDVFAFQRLLRSDVMQASIGYDEGLSRLINHTMPPMPQKSLVGLALLLSLQLSACNYSWIPFTYRQDIHQGNVVSQEMVDQLRPGMSQRQVAFIMGTPMLVDPFHEDRWDYIYSNQPGNDVRIQKNVTLIFQGDQLSQLQGDFRPGTLPSIELKKDSTISVPTISREKTLVQKIKGLFGSDDDD
jgi:outer membrane protein assembly factor BamE